LFGKTPLIAQNDYIFQKFGSTALLAPLATPIHNSSRDSIPTGSLHYGCHDFNIICDVRAGFTHHMWRQARPSPEGFQ